LINSISDFFGSALSSIVLSSCQVSMAELNLQQLQYEKIGFMMLEVLCLTQAFFSFNRKKFCSLKSH